MNNKKIERILKILVIVSIIVFIFIYYTLIFKCINRYYLKGLIFFIPIIFIILLTYLFSKGKIKKKVVIILLIIIVLISIFLDNIYFIFLMINDLMTEVTDINEYERILKLEEYNEMLYQFPSELPESYISVKYFYRPQFLQGSMRMELLLELNENEVNSYIEIYENNCKQIINVKEWSSNELNNIGIITVGIDVFNDEIKEDFIIYLLDSKPYEENNWNHGYAIFIAVNNEKNKILFQSEVW